MGNTVILSSTNDQKCPGDTLMFSTQARKCTRAMLCFHERPQPLVICTAKVESKKEQDSPTYLSNKRSQMPKIYVDVFNQHQPNHLQAGEINCLSNVLMFSIQAHQTIFKRRFQAPEAYVHVFKFTPTMCTRAMPHFGESP